jgi:hypothetical protein
MSFREYLYQSDPTETANRVLDSIIEADSESALAELEESLEFEALLALVVADQEDA